MEKNITFVPVNEHPEMYIGKLVSDILTDNTANSEYSQDTSAQD